ncbi:MAG: ActS/PrrB/RegB family redox-sensitive histidine kinase [Alphaproteobacteria bacterium]|nr:ActS/PrrB/RegB family redox-sensitive histidine kinase [Alphaproteobacteria bacterium]
MVDTAFTPDGAAARQFDSERRVGLRTLVLIRWVAVIGQAVTLLTVHYGFDFRIPIVPALAAVAASALFNLALTFRRPLKSRISPVEAATQLGYDILQLGVLLFLTGGLKNPFALLVLVPVTVSATVLSRGHTIVLGILAAVVITALAIAHLPFPAIGEPVLLPDFYMLGLWEAMILGTVFIAGYVASVSEEARRLSTGFVAAQLALAREQQLAAVGGLAAAAAHELGSPLSTIAVTSREMARDLPPGSELQADAELLVEQSERCRRILAQLGRPLEPDALSPMAQMPIGVLVESAAEPYRDERVELRFEVGAQAGGGRSGEPTVPRRPEIVQGLGTLIQNAVEFAAHTVAIETWWTDGEIVVEIADDGPGFPRAILERFGEPYISNRAGEDGHMGLGIFIAVTLLGRTGGIVLCGNRPGGGATVEVRWSRRVLEEIMALGMERDADR